MTLGMWEYLVFRKASEDLKRGFRTDHERHMKFIYAWMYWREGLRHICGAQLVDELRGESGGSVEPGTIAVGGSVPPGIGGGSYGALGQTAGGNAGPVGQGGGIAGSGFVPPWSDYAVRTAVTEAKKAQVARIREAIDIGGGQACDIEGVVRELDKAGFKIVEKDRRDR